MIETLIERLFHARNAAHIAHWKTKSYAEHKALGHYYEDVIEQLRQQLAAEAEGSDALDALLPL